MTKNLPPRTGQQYSIAYGDYGLGTPSMIFF